MRKIIALFSTLFLLFVAYSIDSLEFNVDLPHKSSFDEYWSLNSEYNDELQSHKEWLPKGASFDNWKEVFAIQAYQLEESIDLELVQYKFLEKLIKDLDKSKQIRHKTHNQNENAIEFEWWVTGRNEKIGEREKVKLVKADNHQLILIRYAWREEINNDLHDKWCQCVEEGKMAPPVRESKVDFQGDKNLTNSENFVAKD